MDTNQDLSDRAPDAPSPLDDRRLIERLANRDAEALAALYDRHIGPVFSLALRIVGEPAEAEAVVQDTFVQAWSDAGRCDARRTSAARWLLGMTRSRAIDRVRARRRVPERAPAGDVATVHLPDPARGEDYDVHSPEEAARLCAALSGLPLLQRLGIELAYFEGVTLSQIAGRLEQSPETMRVHIQTGLGRLQALLEDSGE